MWLYHHWDMRKCGVNETMKPCVYFKCWHCCKELYFTCSRIPRSAFGTWKHWFDFSGQNTVERDENDLSTMRCAIWYHLYNLKKREKHHGGVLLLVKLLAEVTLLHGCLSRFFNWTNGTKSWNASTWLSWVNSVTLEMSSTSFLLPPTHTSCT